MADSPSLSHTPPSAVPSALRVGGALLAVAVVLLITYGITLARGGVVSSFPVTVGFVLIVVAALIVGAFFSVGSAHRASKMRIVALGAAVALIIISRMVSHIVIVTSESMWLVGYAVVCLIGGVIARRRVITSGNVHTSDYRGDSTS